MPSIAAVSRMSIETWNGEGDTGTRVQVNAGGISDVSDVARRRGTTVEVRNLFYNAPVRARFLKSVSAETRAVNEVVTTLSLANPGVSFLLTSDDRVLLDLPSAEEPALRVAQVWGLEHAGTLIRTVGDRDGLRVSGLIQRPDAARAGVRRSHLFVNGRPAWRFALAAAACSFQNAAGALCSPRATTWNTWFAATRDGHLHEHLPQRSRRLAAFCSGEDLLLIRCKASRLLRQALNEFLKGLDPCRLGV